MKDTDIVEKAYELALCNLFNVYFSNMQYGPTAEDAEAQFRRGYDILQAARDKVLLIVNGLAPAKWFCNPDDIDNH